MLVASCAAPGVERGLGFTILDRTGGCGAAASLRDCRAAMASFTLPRRGESSAMFRGAIASASSRCCVRYVINSGPALRGGLRKR